jgi:hypothetical protein
MRKRRKPKPAGRPPKVDKELWSQITCVLRKDTIQRLKDGVGGHKFFGQFLQDHLDRFPPPTFEQYQAYRTNRPLMITLRGRRVPTVISAGAGNRVKRVPRPKTEEELEFEREYMALKRRRNDNS